MWCPQQISPRGEVYRVNNTGPRTEPCGPPCVCLAAPDSRPFITTFCVLPVKYEHIQLNAVPLKPKQYFSLISNIAWFTVLKAADKSRRIRHVTSLLSIALNKSVITFSRAVSVEQLAWYADCNFSKLSVDSGYVVIWPHTVLSISFERYDKLWKLGIILEDRFQVNFLQEWF